MNVNYPFLYAIIINDIEMMKLIIEYANSKNIILNCYDCYPMYEAI